MLATHGHARLRVEGRGFGFLRVGLERRWVRGQFDETFVVELPGASGEVKVGFGLFGTRVCRVVPYGPTIDLRSPPLLSQMPAVQTYMPSPRSRRLEVRRILAPQLVQLRRTPIQSVSRESESTS